MADSANVAIRKRQQIAQANRVMFLWVAGASAILGISAVLGLTLFNKLTFNQSIIDKQGRTLRTLEDNNQAVSSLMDNARVLDTNQLLKDKRLEESDTPLQVILDALPSEPNRVALGASLQEVLLKVDGVTIENLTVDEVETATIEPVSGPTSSIPLGFGFTASSPDINKLFELLTRLERSIRPIKVQSLDFEVGEGQTALTAKAVSYYQPSVSIDLGQETLPKKRAQ